MAIERKLLYFKTQANFDKALEAEEVQNYNLAFIQDTQKIWTHGVYFSSLGEVFEELNTKANQTDLESLSATVSTKADQADLESLSATVDTKANQTDVTELQSSKQDKLTAGDGIEITSDNVINTTLDTNPFVFVDELPTSDIKEGKLYCVPNAESTEENNIFDEYYYHDDAWELMGQYIPKVDLTPYDKTEDREALIESSEDDDYVIKHVDSEGNVLTGIKANGEVYIPIGIPDDTYDLIYSLYEKLKETVTAVEEVASLTGGDYDYTANRKSLIDSTSDDTYVLKMQDSQGNLLEGFTEHGEIEIPLGISDDTYTLFQTVLNKFKDVKKFLVDTKYEIDDLNAGTAKVPTSISATYSGSVDSGTITVTTVPEDACKGVFYYCTDYPWNYIFDGQGGYTYKSDESGDSASIPVSVNIKIISVLDPNVSYTLEIDSTGSASGGGMPDTGDNPNPDDDNPDDDEPNEEPES